MSGVQPFFSVLIVNYNAGELLQNALNSLKKQSFRDFEVVVVDNDSQRMPLDPRFVIVAQVIGRVARGAFFDF